jgi:Tol biopolymer transport system component
VVAFLFVGLLVASGTAWAQSLRVSHVAGTLGGPGATDSAGTAARFTVPYGVAVDVNGSIYVADTGNHTIRRITAGGIVTTLAGEPGVIGSDDGQGTAARFSSPQGVAVDASGTVYVADRGNHSIRKVTAAGVVTTLAGLAGNFGGTDGAGSAARFNLPRGVAVDPSGNVYVADTNNHTIRRVTPAGVVTTLAGLAATSGTADGAGGAARFFRPSAVAVDGAGVLYIADTDNHAIRRVTPAGVVTTLAGLAGSSGNADGSGSAARFLLPAGVTVDGAGTLYVGDTNNQTIRKVTPAGVVTTVAGQVSSSGSLDGTASAARFNQPAGVAVDGVGNVYVGDTNNHSIRKMTAAGVVATLAGAAGIAGVEDGAGAAARFNSPGGVAVDAAGTVYVADTFNHTVRRITSGGLTTTFAGSPGNFGTADGTGPAARFHHLSGVAVDGAGTVYVTDTSNHTIRKITPAGVVTTLAGSPGSPGSADGTGSAARFNFPSGVAVDGAGIVYVADSSNHSIRRITPAGAVTTLAGLADASGTADGTGTAARFFAPDGIAVDASGTLYVADTRNHTIRRVTAAGVVTTLAGGAGIAGSADGTGTGARFRSPRGLGVDTLGNLFVADSDNSTIRRVSTFASVTTVAGLAGNLGTADGTGTAARLNRPAGIAVDAAGTVYVAESVGHRIRRAAVPVRPRAVSTTAGTAGAAGSADGTGPAARFSTPVGVTALYDDGPTPVYVADTSNHTVREVDPTTGVVTTIAGLAGVSGTANGTGASARFNQPFGIAQSSGSLYVADTYNHTLRMINPGTGIVTLLAGIPGNFGSADGTGTSATFNFPVAVAAADDGTLYVADRGNHTVRKVTAGGVVTTFAGAPGQAGSVDGAGSSARFSGPYGIAVDFDGTVYVGDTGNHTIRRITPDGVVATLAGLAGVSGSADGLGSAARFLDPRGLTVRGGTVFVADTGNRTVREITPYGEVRTIAGGVGLAGSVDGVGSAARFTWPVGVVLHWDGVFIVDSGDHTVRLGRPSQVLEVGPTASGSGTVTSAPAGITCGGDCEEHFARGTVVTLSPSPAAGSVFTRWLGACTGAGSCQVSMTGDQRVTAAFELAPKTLTVNRSGTGAGTVTSAPAGIDCGADCSEAYTHGILVALSASAAPGSVFTGWSGACAGTGPCQVTLDTARSVTASFGGPQTLTVTRSGIGTGTVTSSPAGIDCGVDCSETYTYGALVTLTATAEVGSDFTGWSNGCTGTGVCQVTMDAARSVGANFDRQRRTLTMTRAGTGSGTVVPVPPLDPYNWGYFYGTVVTVTATPALGSAFTGWTGACSGTGTCQVTMDADTSVTATFEARPTLMVTRVGSGTGTVTSAAVGIECGADCTEAYPSGTVVTLTALAAPGAVFSGWSGPCSGQGACQVTLSASGEVTASFTALTERYRFSHLAGPSGGRGSADGVGSAARFDFPAGIAVDAAGITYVADTANHTIRKISSAGVVTTLAGLAGAPGSADGTGPDARFQEPNGVAVDGGGVVYVADSGNHTIRRITPAGVVTTLAGFALLHGSTDGPGSTARFGYPTGIAVDQTGTLYVADFGNHTIRKISRAGVVTTLAGLAGSIGDADGEATAARFSQPSGIAVDGSGTVYVVEVGNQTLRRIAPTGAVTTLAGTAAGFYMPRGVAVDTENTVFVADTSNHTIRTVSPAGVVTTLAGLAGNVGGTDGQGSEARFFSPAAVAVDSEGSLFVADSNNAMIRKVTSAGVVTTVAGAPAGAGRADGTARTARFNRPAGVAVHAAGPVYVADHDNHTVRRVTARGEVTTLAGLAGSYGVADGTGSMARFYFPSATAVDDAGHVFVADQAGHTIRQVTPAGIVTTLAGLPATWGSADGTGSAARFFQPSGLALDGAGILYVADGGNHTIRKVTRAGVVTTLAGLAGSGASADGTGSAARFSSPAAVAVDGQGTVYVADSNNHTIRKVTPAGVVSTLAGLAGNAGSSDGLGGAARFNRPRGIAVDSTGHVYVADSGNHAIRKVTPSGEVTTIAGLAGSVGNADGTGSAARFNQPWGVAVDAAGRLYVGDSANHSIRRGVPDWPLTLTATLAGTGTGVVTSNPAGVACGADCAEAYPFDTVVTLAASAAAGSVFTGWSGACTGTGTCEVTLTAATAVTATFATAGAAPTLTSVAPASGPTTGGTIVTVSGTDLATTTGVTIGGTAAAIVGTPTPMSVAVTTPPGIAGPRDIAVTTSLGTATVVGGFTYDASAKITDESAGANGDTLQPSLDADGRYLAFLSLATNLVDGDTNGVGDIFVRDRANGSIVRVSVGADGAQANGPSERPRISANGRYVVFVSSATNLVAGDSNAAADVFLHDRDTDADGAFDEPDARATLRVSVASDGQQANGTSGQPDLSPDGLWVAFVSSASDLVAGDTNGVDDVFLHHWPSGQTRRVSVATGGGQANGPSRAPGVSRLATLVVFASDATNLVDADGNRLRDVFVHERESGLTVRVSTAAGTGEDADGASDNPSIDDAGRVLAFQTTAGNVTGGPAGPPDVNQVVAFVWGAAAPVILEGPARAAAPVVCIACALRQLLSGSTQTQPGSDDSTNPEVAGGGTGVIFESESNDLADGDANGRKDVFKSEVDPVTGEASAPVNVSREQGGTQSDGDSQAGAISGDGRQSAFQSNSKLTAGSTNQTSVYVRGERLLVNRLSPPSKPADTNEAIVIEGAGFAPGVTVHFGSQRAPRVTLTGSTRLDVDVPTAAAAGVVDIVVANVDGERVTWPSAFTYLEPPSDAREDTDGDTLPDSFEEEFGLDKMSAAGPQGAAGDPDGDGRTNSQEYAAGTHPRGTFTRFLAEGASTEFFTTRVAMANPSEAQTVTALLRFQKADGTAHSATVVVPPRESRKFTVNFLPQMQKSEFATVVESDGPLVVDRLMWWDNVTGYGSHADTAVRAPGLVWYLAEGATHSGFDLFYLLQNPSATHAADVRVRYLRPSGAPLEKTYRVAPSARFNIWVDTEQFPDGSGNLALANTDVSAVFEVTNGVPIIVERAMYLSRAGQQFSAGHESAAVAEPALTWFLAEGATGDFFDQFVLLANPNPAAAVATVTYLLEDGRTFARDVEVPGNSRQNIWVDLETIPGVPGLPLAHVAVSTKVEVTNGVPIIVERAMWWPGDGGRWNEAHNSPGSTVTGTAWGMAEGVVLDSVSSYILVANTSATPAAVQVTLLFDGQTPVARTFAVPATSRLTIDVSAEFPAARGREFGALVESLPVDGTPPAQIAVERAMYADAAGVTWASGNNQLATRLR